MEVVEAQSSKQTTADVSVVERVQSTMMEAPQQLINYLASANGLFHNAFNMTGPDPTIPNALRSQG